MTRLSAIRAALETIDAFVRANPGAHVTYAEGERTIFVSAFAPDRGVTTANVHATLKKDFPFEPPTVGEGQKRSV